MYTDDNVGGIFDFLTKTATSVANVATQAAAVKAAWKGVPYAYAPSAAPSILPYTPTAPPDRALTRDEIRELQTRLNSLGFNAGQVDGIFGPKTSAGIKAFQSARGQSQTGTASLRLLDDVRLVSAPAASGAQLPSGPGIPLPLPVFTPPIVYRPAPPAPAPKKKKRAAPVAQASFMSKIPAWAIPAGAAAVLAFVMLGKRR